MREYSGCNNVSRRLERVNRKSKRDRGRSPSTEIEHTSGRFFQCRQWESRGYAPSVLGSKLKVHASLQGTPPSIDPVTM
eukprot:5913430-Prymnesium_polylepis.1